MKLKGLISLFVCLCFCAGAFAQDVSSGTRVRGRVIDASNGQPVAMAAVYFLDSSIGTMTDDQGVFAISTQDVSLRYVRIQLLGYKTAMIEVKPGAYTEKDVMLFVQDNRLDAITVRPDNEKAKRLLAQIDKHRAANNPDQKDAYSCDLYSKMELGLNQPRQLLFGKRLKKEWQFIFDYIDTSEINGQEYLPVLISESVAKRSHRLDPTSDTETLVATRTSGAENLRDLMTQFTGSLHLRSNFYSPFINIFNVEIPSPVNAAGLLYYDYYIVDSLDVDSRKTLVVHYHPKSYSSHLALDGQMLVDAEDFAIKEIKGASARGMGINWVKDIRLESSYQRLEDGTWFFKTDKFYADFSVVPSDSSMFVSLPLRRTIDYLRPCFERDSAVVSPSRVVVDEGSYLKPESYWEQARPRNLSARESGVYTMIEKVHDTPLYNTWYDVIAMIVNGYYDVGPVGFGPILKVFSYNPLEGFKIVAGMHTSAAFSKKDRLSFYVGFGCKDLQAKGGLKWEHLFKKNPTSKLTLDGHYDVLQLGKGFSEFNDGNILSAALGDGWRSRLSKVAEGSLLYEQEFTPGINSAWQLMYRQYFATPFAPLDFRGESLHSIPTAAASATLRFSWDETTLRGDFLKTYVKTKYPVLTLRLDGGVAVLGNTYHPFFTPELSLDWKAPVPPIGTSKLHFDVGTVLGQVPYPLLHIHEGNATYLRNENSFSTMDYLEFASDTWTTLRFEHNFMGILFGKIPYIKKLNWREVVSVNATWGCLSKRNNGIVGDASGAGLLYFPEGMREMGNVPFVEAGFGITNIFRLLRVDFMWRCTHRNDPGSNPRKFMLNLGVELTF